MPLRVTPSHFSPSGCRQYIASCSFVGSLSFTVTTSKRSVAVKGSGPLVCNPCACNAPKAAGVATAKAISVAGTTHFATRGRRLRNSSNTSKSISSSIEGHQFVNGKSTLTKIRTDPRQPAGFLLSHLFFFVNEQAFFFERIVNLSGTAVTEVLFMLSCLSKRSRNSSRRSIPCRWIFSHSPLPGPDLAFQFSNLYGHRSMNSTAQFKKNPGPLLAFRFWPSRHALRSSS